MGVEPSCDKGVDKDVANNSASVGVTASKLRALHGSHVHVSSLMLRSHCHTERATYQTSRR